MRLGLRNMSSKSLAYELYPILTRTGYFWQSQVSVYIIALVIYPLLTNPKNNLRSETITSDLKRTILEAQQTDKRSPKS